MYAYSYLYIYWRHFDVCIQLPVHILETFRYLYIVTGTYTGDVLMSVHSCLYIYWRHLDVCTQLLVHILETYSYLYIYWRHQGVCIYLLVHILEISRCLYIVTCTYTGENQMYVWQHPKLPILSLPNLKLPSPISRFPNCRHMKNIVIASRIMLLIYEGIF